MRVNNKTIMMQQGSGSFNVQASLDVRDLATVAQFLVAKGEIKEGTYGQIISWCFELSLTYLRHNYAYELQEYELIDDALARLKSMDYSIEQFKGGRNRQLIRGMKNEALQQDFGTTIGQRQYAGSAKQAHSMEYSTSPEYTGHKEQGEYVPQVQNVEVGPPKISLDLAEAAAKQLYEQFGTKHEDFLYLWDDTIPNPHLNQEQRDRLEQVSSYMKKIMPEYLEQQEELHRPRTPEEVQANLKSSALALMLKNATSRQQMPIPKELEELVKSPEMIAEIEPLIEPYRLEREKEQLAREAERQLVVDEKARRQTGV